MSLAFSWVPIVNIFGIVVGIVGIIIGLVGVFVSHRIMSAVGIVLALVGVIAAIAVNNSFAKALSNSATAPAPNVGSQGAVDPNAPPPAFPGATSNDQIAQAGQPVNKDGLSLTSSAVKAGDSSFGKTLCTTVEYNNGTDAAVSFNGFDWKLQDPNGTILSMTFSGSQKALNSGDLAPGGSVSGEVCFDNKSNAPGQHIVLYQGSIFSGERIAWLNKT